MITKCTEISFKHFKCISSSSFDNNRKGREQTVTEYLPLSLENAQSIFSHCGGEEEEFVYRSKLLITSILYIVTNF